MDEICINPIQDNMKEVVYCKECQWSGMHTEKGLKCYGHSFDGIPMPFHGYCWKGVKRSETR